MINHWTVTQPRSTSLTATSKNHRIHLYEIYSSDIADLSSGFFLLSSVVPHSFFHLLSTLKFDVGSISQRLGYNVWTKSLSCIVFLNENFFKARLILIPRQTLPKTAPMPVSGILMSTYPNSRVYNKSRCDAIPTLWWLCLFCRRGVFSCSKVASVVLTLEGRPRWLVVVLLLLWIFLKAARLASLGAPAPGNASYQRTSSSAFFPGAEWFKPYR